MALRPSRRARPRATRSTHSITADRREAAESKDSRCLDAAARGFHGRPCGSEHLRSTIDHGA
jgi:hypothetical protein